MSVTLVHWKHMQRNGVKRFRSAPNLGIFVKEVFEVVGEVNDALLHLGDAAPPIELNFAEELWVVCHLDDHPAGGSLEGATGNSKKVWPNNSRVLETRMWKPGRCCFLTSTQISSHRCHISQVNRSLDECDCPALTVVRQ